MPAAITVCDDTKGSGKIGSYQRILVGVDFSMLNEAALRTAHRLARESDADLTVIAVHRPSSSHEESENGIAKTARSLEKFTKTILGHAKGVRLRTLIGDPYAELQRACEQGRADLLILGASGEEHPQASFGHTAHQCLRSMSIDVLFVHAKSRQPFLTVLAAVDYDREAQNILGRAASLAALESAHLDCFHVRPAVGSLSLRRIAFSSGETYREEESYVDVEHQLDTFLRSILPTDATLKWSSRNTEAFDLAKGITSQVGENENALLVVGVNKRTPIAGLFRRQIAEYVLKHSRCAVLAVRSRAQENADWG